jgi:acetolactate synthase I/II/III large subunit
MNAAECLFRTAVAAGLDVCFANPGTSELPLVAAIDSAPGMRAELCLFEGVCTGAADGYARMAGKPALTLLHTGPGFANGFANLHNARRANTPIVNLVGDQPTWHLQYDPPLTSDIEAIARPNSTWVHTSRSASEVPGDLARAVAASLKPPGGVATLIVPLDCMWADGGEPAPPPVPGKPTAVAGNTIAAIAETLRNSRSAALMLGGPALHADGLRAAARIAQATGCRLLCKTSIARIERGPGLAQVERLPYFPDAAMAALAELSDLVLAGSGEPVTFFGYEDYPSRSAPEDCRRHALATGGEDIAGALEAVADALGAPRQATLADAPPPGPPPTGALTPKSMAAAIAYVQPEGAIIVDEGVSSGRPAFDAAAGAPAHTFMSITGGSIGFGIPCATGVGVACPDRPVITLEADGSGMYTVQGLWTQARGGLDVTTVIFSNRGYRIIEMERHRAGLPEFGPQGKALTDLTGPALDWPAIAKGHGVPGVRVDDVEGFTRELKRALAEPGPHLIEALM